MRRYALLYDNTSMTWSIIYRDVADEPEAWFMLQSDLPEDNARLFLGALNEAATR